MPKATSSAWAVFKLQVVCFLLALVEPEYLVFFAIRERNMVHKLSKDLAATYKASFLHVTFLA